MEWKDVIGKQAAKQVPITVYEFKELNPKAKEYAKKLWYEDEDYPFLSDDLTEFIKTELENAGIQYDKLKVLYDLGYSQGSGLCFEGNFVYKNTRIIVKQSGHYYHSNSVSFDFEDENYESIDENETTNEFKGIYKDICRKAEKAGYKEIEYRMTDEEFDELCDANGYNFYESGKMANLKNNPTRSSLK